MKGQAITTLVTRHSTALLLMQALRDRAPEEVFDPLRRVLYKYFQQEALNPPQRALNYPH